MTRLRNGFQSIMKNRPSLILCVLIVLSLAASLILAANGPERVSDARASTPPSSQSDGSQIVTTHHQIALHGRVLKYTARAGLLPIRVNETGRIHAYIFFISYSVDRTPGHLPRPLTFVWNGGPGSNSSLLHFIGIGPKRIKTSDTPTEPMPPKAEFEDNQDTWLDQTDLVFVDPVGTGYSRPVRAKFEPEFYNTLGDIASIAEFIRVYRTHFDAWDSPLFLAGESYGVWRAAGVAEAIEHRGQRVAGVILMSGGIPFGPVISDDEKTAHFVPGRAAAAFFHKKLPPDLQINLQATLKRADAWAETDYADALKNRSNLTEQQRENIIAQLTRFTGIDADLIDNQTLTVSRRQFVTGLLQNSHQTLDTFDMRLTRDQNPVGGSRNVLITRYMRSNLQFKTDLIYQDLGIEGYMPMPGPEYKSVGAKWDYNQAPIPPSGNETKAGMAGVAVSSAPAAKANQSDDGPPGGSRPWLRQAMTIDPALKAFVAAGLYDSLNSCFANSYLVGRLDAKFKGNITVGCYDGGHVIYRDKDARVQLKRDIARFIHTALHSPDSTH